jgi:hypothetical protein
MSIDRPGKRLGVGAGAYAAAHGFGGLVPLVEAALTPGDGGVAKASAYPRPFNIARIVNMGGDSA